MSVSLESRNRPHIALARLFERVNREGRRYLVGRIGSAKLLIVPTGEISRGEVVWQAILGEGFYDEKNGAVMAQGIED
jgi:hypothetical protein